MWEVQPRAVRLHPGAWAHDRHEVVAAGYVKCHLKGQQGGRGEPSAGITTAAKCRCAALSAGRSTLVAGLRPVAAACASMLSAEIVEPARRAGRTLALLLA